MTILYCLCLMAKYIQVADGLSAIQACKSFYGPVMKVDLKDHRSCALHALVLDLFHLLLKQSDLVAQVNVSQAKFMASFCFKCLKASCTFHFNARVRT
jgi:hypothetical protein